MTEPLRSPFTSSCPKGSGELCCGKVLGPLMGGAWRGTLWRCPMRGGRGGGVESLGGSSGGSTVLTGDSSPPQPVESSRLRRGGRGGGISSPAASGCRCGTNIGGNTVAVGSGPGLLQPPAKVETVLTLTRDAAMGKMHML